MSQYIAEDLKIVNLVGPVSIASGASAAYVNMENYTHVDFVVATGAVTSPSSTVIAIKRAKNTSGDSIQTQAITGYYHNKAALADASIDNDTFVRITSLSTSSTAFKLQNQASTIYIIPIDATEITDVTGGFNSLGVEISSGGGATIASLTAILSGNRYSGVQPPTTIG